MKKLIFLILATAILLSSCAKEEMDDATLSTDATSSSLKCGSIGDNDHLNKFKWRQINEMVKNIHWIQQACFKIETCKYKIYTDPLEIKQTDKANIILISHNHDDHYSLDDINKITGPNTIIIAPEDCNYNGTAKWIVLKPGEVYKSRNIKIKAVPAYNITKTQFHPQSNNWVGYVITINGVSIYHAGDTERIPEMKDITCDIALLPLGQTYTMNSVADAAESAKDVKAKIAIPMHYDYYEGTLEDAQTFKSLLEGYVKVVIKNRGE